MAFYIPWKKPRLWLYTCLLCGAFIALSVLTLLIGFKTGKNPSSEIHQKIQKVDKKLHKIKTIFADLTPFNDSNYSNATHTAVIDTALTGMSLRYKKISNARSANDGKYVNTGGAITSFNNYLIIVDSKGQFYAGADLPSIQAIDIIAPDTYSSRYQQVIKDEKYNDVKKQETPLKYNDLSFYISEHERGLLISYTEFDQIEPCYRNVLAKLTFNINDDEEILSMQAAMEDWKILYKTNPCIALQDQGSSAMVGQMAGGAIVFEAPNTVFMSTGDFFFDGMGFASTPIAQDIGSDYGKVLKIDMNSGQSTIFSTGHRNPQGLVRSANGHLFLVEHGPKGGDELNLIEEGKNYGWPYESYGTSYLGTSMVYSDSYARHDTYTPPIHAWLPSIATSALIELGGFDPSWDGDLLVASLAARSMYRIRLANTAVAYAEKIPLGKRIRDMHSFKQYIVFWTDDMDVIFAETKPHAQIGVYIDMYERSRKLTPERKKRLSNNIGECVECHNFITASHTAAPSLKTVYQRAIAQSSFDHYSDALKATTGRWDLPSLETYILKPQAFAPGTYMRSLDLDDTDTKELADFLSFIKQTP